MRALSIAPVLLLLAPLACGDDKQTTHTESSGLSSSEAGTTVPDASTTDVPTTGVPTTGGPTTEVTLSTAGSESVGPTTDGETTAGVTTDAETTAGTSTTGAVGCSGDAPKVLLVTTLGEMVVQLDAVNAPVTTANFLEYVEAGFYDDTIFHRVIDGFVIQGGGFTGDLMQKPTNPPIALETSPALKHVDGAIAMARTNDPNSATSQFYVCDGPQPGLDDMYAVFGVLVEGFDVLAAISAVAVQDEGGFTDVPVEDVFVTMAYCV